MSRLVQTEPAMKPLTIGKIVDKRLHEPTWAGCTHPRLLVDALSPAPTDRKLRLLIVGFARRLMRFLPDDSYRDALVAAEKFADGEIGKAELKAARVRLDPNSLSRGSDVRWLVCHTTWPGASRVYSRGINCAVRQGERIARANLVRDLFGHYCRPDIEFTPWLSADVVGIAHMIYNENRFDHMPILADALEENGCDSEIVLGHCRGDGYHVRGCWIVDRILGIE